MNHAMLLHRRRHREKTCPPLPRGGSWGEDRGDKGFFTMDAAWFDANVF